MAERYYSLLAVRVTYDHRDRWRAAADREGLSLSAWVRRTLDRACEPERPERCETCDSRGPLYQDSRGWVCAQCLAMEEDE